jgi:hypothetical protein
MFQCMKSGCPWACGTRRNVSCGEDLLKRALASVLWLVLLGSILAGALTLMQETRAADYSGPDHIQLSRSAGVR